MLTQSKLPRLLLLPLACAGLALCGCGSSSGTASSDPPLTKAEFIKEAEEICRQGVSEKEKAVAAGLESGKVTKESSPAEMKRFIEAAVQPFSKVVARLSQLHPADGDKAAVALVRSYETALKDVESNPLGAIEQNPFLRPDKAAEAYGLKSCLL
jgi:hypothetical protein